MRLRNVRRLPFRPFFRMKIFSRHCLGPLLGLLLLTCGTSAVASPTDPRDFCWGDRGRISANFFAGGTDTMRSPRALAIVPSGPHAGKIYLVGSIGSGSGSTADLVVVRLMPDGSVDTSFGINGAVRHDDNRVLHRVFSADFDSQNRLVVTASSGAVNSEHIRVTRLNLDGSRDLTFGTNGVYTDVFGWSQSVLRGAALQSDDKILLAGYVQDGGNANDQLLMARLNTNGTRDAYSIDARDGSNWNVHVRALLPTSDGNYAALKVQQGVPVRVSFRNSTLAQTSSVPVPTPADHTIDWGFDMSVLPGGKILVLVRGNTPGGTGRSYILRLNADGSLDSTFNANGASESVSLNPDGVDNPNQIRVDADGFIYVGSGYNTIARWTADGALDTSWGLNGVASVPNLDATTGYGPESLVFDADGNVLAVGTDRSIEGRDNFFAYKIWKNHPAEVQTFCDDVVGLPQSDLVRPGSSNPVLQFEVVASGDLDPLPLTTASFLTTGTTDVSKIERARLFFGGTNRNFSEAISLGTIEAPGGSLAFSDLFVELEHGVNNFWLVYQTAADTPVDHLFDAEIVSLTIDEQLVAPQVASPAGNVRAANVIAQWKVSDFNSATDIELPGTSYVAGVTADPMVAGAGVSLQTEPYYGAGAFLVTDWPTGSSRGASDYIGVSLSVAAGTNVTYESAVYGLVADGWYGAPAKAEFRGSTDGFNASNIGFATHNLEALTADGYLGQETYTTGITALGTTSQSVAFRWFPYDDPHGWVDSQTIFGLSNISSHADAIYSGTGSDLYILGTVESPSASVSAIVRQSPTSGVVASGPGVFRVILDKAVSGLTASNFALGQTVAGASITAVTPVGAPTSDRWDVSVNFGSVDGFVRLDVVDTSGVSPAIAGLPYLSGDRYVVDSSLVPANTAPVVASYSIPDVTQSSAGQTEYTFSITYEDSDGTIDHASLNASNVTIDGLTVTGATVTSSTDGSTTVEYTATPPGGSWNDADNGTHTVAVAANQVADNGGAYVAAGTVATFNVSMDTTAPVFTGVSRLNPLATVTNADALVFRVSFSEAVQQLDGSDFSVSGTTATVTAIQGITPTIFDLTVSGGDLAGVNGTVSLALAGANNITDGTGNAVANTTPSGDNQTYTLDNSAPGLTISSPSPAATLSGPVEFLISYSDASSILLNPGHVALNTTGTATGSVAVFAINSDSRLVLIHSISGVGTIGISIDAGSAHDAAGNLAPAAGPSETFSVTDGIKDLAGNVMVSGVPTAVNETYTIVFNAPPVIGGTLTGIAIGDAQTTAPFETVTIEDPEDDAVSLSVTIDDPAKGAFTPASLDASGFQDDGNGVYSFSAPSADVAQDAIRQLIFAPVPNRLAPGLHETVGFTIVASDGISESQNDSTTVIVTSVNNAPTSLTYTGVSAFWIYDPDHSSLGTFAVTDVDDVNHFLSIVSVNGAASGTAFNAFEIDGNHLRVVHPQGLEPGSYTVIARATDAGGLSVDTTISLMVNGTLTVTTAADESAATGETVAANSADGGGLSLREAFHFARTGTVVRLDAALEGATLSLGSPVAVTGTVTLDATAVDHATITGASLVLSDPLWIENAVGGELTLSSPLTGVGGGLVTQGAGTVILTAANDYDRYTVVDGGTVVVSGTIGSNDVLVVSNGGTLSGTGMIDSLVRVFDGGRLAPGGTLSLNGGLELQSGSSLSLALNGATPGSGHGQVAVHGTVSLDGAILELSLGHDYTPSGSDVLTILANDGLDAVTGTFAGIWEASAVSAGGSSFAISYVGGDGNDIVLIANRTPDAPVLHTPVNFEDLETSGRTLQARPVLVWTIPGDADGNPLHFVVLGESMIDTSFLAESSADTTGFEYWNGVAWAAFPETGVPSSAEGSLARYRPQADLTATTWMWTVHATDGLATSDPATPALFVRADPEGVWNPILGDGLRISKTFVDQLRQEINHLRRFRGLEPAAWSDELLTANQSIVRTVHLLEMRTALTEALEAGGEAVPLWRTLTPHETHIQTTDFEQLRDALGTTILWN